MSLLSRSTLYVESYCDVSKPSSYVKRSKMIHLVKYTDTVHPINECLWNASMNTHCDKYSTITCYKTKVYPRLLLSSQFDKF